jgi:hypothetical protein
VCKMLWTIEHFDLQDFLNEVSLFLLEQTA